jgi:glycosyltransferase involved in cell wall biosynthesis
MENGLIYDSSYEDFLKKVLMLMEDTSLIDRLGSNAYKTICEYWNPANAAAQIIRFYNNYIDNKIEPPTEGPLSVAEDIKPV